MKERPILFIGPMVRAILEGRKTVTRRALRTQPVLDGEFWVLGAAGWSVHAKSVTPVAGHSLAGACPYGQPGDRLWVRENWKYAGWTEEGEPYIGYQADGARILQENFPEEWVSRLEAEWAALSEPSNYNIDGRAADRRWRPSIHMPRWASRILLEITAVRVERLQNISTEQIIAEGLSTTMREHDAVVDLRQQWRELWESINGTESWAADPWVWVVEFRRVMK